MSASPPKDADEQGVAHTPDEVNQLAMEGHDSHGAEAFEFEVKEQDRWLPIANVARIMKTALPENAKIAKEAKECMQECVSEFISFITSEASEKCHQEKRKTVNGEDILFAMTSLGFENYSEALKIYLAKYRETQATRSDAPQNPARPDSQGGFPSEGDGARAGVVADASALILPGDSSTLLAGTLPGTEHDPSTYTLYGAQNNGAGGSY